MTFNINDVTKQRFWSKVNICSDNECWEWKAWKDADGYGKFRVNTQRQTRAHRFSWELANNRPVPDNLVVRHLCNNPGCCNALHLAVGTPKDNREDCLKAERQARGETHPNSKLLEQDIINIRNLHKQGVPPRELAKHFNVTSNCISSILFGNRKNWSHVSLESISSDVFDTSQFSTDKMPRGEECGNSKLTTKQVIQIKQMLKSGITQASIAQKFNVDRSTIGYIKTGKNWSHISIDD